MSLTGFESKISESELPQTHALDRAATGIGHLFGLNILNRQIVTNCPVVSAEVKKSSPKI